MRKIVISGILLASIAMLLALLWHGCCDRHLRKFFEYYLSNKHFTTIVTDLNTSNGVITIDKLSITQTDGTTLSAEQIRITFNLRNLKNLIFSTIIHVNKVELVSSSKEKVIHASTTIDHNLQLLQFKSDIQIKIDKIKSNLLQTNHDFTSVCHITRQINSTQISQCAILFNPTSYLSLNSTIDANNSNVQISTHNIPVTFYNIAKQILPENQVLSFLHNHIPQGNIISGELNLNLDSELLHDTALTEQQLNASFKLQDVEFNYDSRFPAIKNAEIDVIISGSSLKIPIKQAYINSSLIYDGMVTLNWQDLDSKVSAEASASGPAVDLISFISDTELKYIKEHGIDLNKIDGVAKSTIKISIPVDPIKAHSYLITTDVTGVKLRAFNDQLKLDGASIHGTFDGSKLVLRGKGKVNNFDSVLKLEHNIVNHTEFTTLLQTTSNVTANNQKIDAIHLISGNAIVDLQYQHKNEQHNITIKSNLKNLEFALDHISIHKLAGVKANLEITNNLSTQNNLTKFKLIGEDNLNLTGTLQIVDKGYKLLLSSIKHHNNDIKGDITMGSSGFIARISGNQLDLSAVDMTDFLREHQKNTATNLNIGVTRIKLKNNVWLDDVQLALKCDKKRCFQGKLDAKIGNDFIKMLLIPFDNKEEWRITTNNIGIILQGLGISNKVKAGSAEILLYTGRNQGKVGEIIPILDGSFTYNKLVVANMPFLTRLVSVISLPGFMKFITNNNSIAFSDIIGKFSYQNNILTISDVSANGSSFDFTMKGSINTNQHKIKLKGRIIPSLYGINKIIKLVPIVNKIFSGGRRKGIVSAPYFIERSY